MHLSASALKEFTKCGYAFKLGRVDMIAEPGPKSFGMLYGNIVHDAIAEAAEWINQGSELTELILGEILTNAYAKNLEKNCIVSDTVELVKQLLTVGNSPELPMLLYNASQSLNCTTDGNPARYELKIPDLLKNGSLPNNKKKPTLDQLITKMYDDCHWFLFEHHYAEAYKSATSMVHEQYFEYEIPPETVAKYLDGHPFEDQIIITGYFDEVLNFNNGDTHLSEWKTDKTAYSDAFLSRMVQLLTYRIAAGDKPRYFLADISHKKQLELHATQEMLDLTLKRFVDLAKATYYGIYIPACGTDPYTDGKILCGYKCGGCPFADPAAEDEEEAA